MMPSQHTRSSCKSGLLHLDASFSAPFTVYMDIFERRVHKFVLQHVLGLRATVLKKGATSGVQSVTIVFARVYQLLQLQLQLSQ
jgi:hypothetical protein